MIGNGEVMLAIHERRQTAMGSKLPDKLIPEGMAQGLFQFASRQIAG